MVVLVRDGSSEVGGGSGKRRLCNETFMIHGIDGRKVEIFTSKVSSKVWVLSLPFNQTSDWLKGNRKHHIHANPQTT